LNEQAHDLAPAENADGAEDKNDGDNDMHHDLGNDGGDNGSDNDFTTGNDVGGDDASDIAAGGDNHDRDDDGSGNHRHASDIAGNDNHDRDDDGSGNHSGKNRDSGAGAGGQPREKMQEHQNPSSKIYSHSWHPECRLLHQLHQCSHGCCYPGCPWTFLV
jgi:hypothetical protein